MQLNPPSVTLLVHCEDRIGLVAKVTDFLYRHQANIMHLDEHVDRKTGIFFMRVEWDLDGFLLDRDEIADRFKKELADSIQMQWELHFSDETIRMAIFASTMPHCLYDLIASTLEDDWNVEIPLIISNHETLKAVAEKFSIPFHHFNLTAKNKQEQEQEQIRLLNQHNVDLVILARYMQILTDQFIANFPNRIINIHHSFLPAFPGAKPYHSAHSRGVKIIGSTSHYVTADLDAGPIIEQDVTRVTHQDDVRDLVRKGKNLEKIVLSRAVHAHIKRRIIVHNNKTVVF